MDLIADILLSSGAFGAGIYCYVLARRLKRFTALETGMGGAIAVLSAQVDDMTRALDAAQASANGSVSSLSDLTERAEKAARRIELLMATLHDLPPQTPSRPPPAPPEAYDDGGIEDGSDDDKKLRFIRRRSSREFVEAAE